MTALETIDLADERAARMAASMPLLVPGESDFIYHALADHFLPSHRLAEFRKSPRHYWLRVYGDVKDVDRVAYQVGRATHTALLEGPEAYAARYEVGGPVNERTGKPFGAATKAYEEWADLVRSRGLDPLSRDQGDLVVELVAAVHDHRLAMDLLAFGNPNALSELTVRARYCEEPCQARIDRFIGGRAVVDFKTTDSLDTFARDARRYGYFHQLAFYRAVTACALPEALGYACILLAVEKAPPYRVGVFDLLEADLRQAQEENEDAIRRLRECRETACWPSGYEDLRVLTMGD
jgi:hypothetical protein